MSKLKSYYTPRSIRKNAEKSKKRLIIAIVLTIIFLYLLINWGIPLLIGSLSVFNTFRKPKEKQAAVDILLAPPVLDIPFESTNSAEIRITGYAAAESTVEIYIDDELRADIKVNEQGNFETNPLSLSIGTNNIYGKTVDKDGKKSLPSKNIKLIYNNEKPKLEVTEPNDNKEIQGGDKKVKVSGKTDPENTLSINGQSVIINGDGNFSKEIEIPEGESTITISAQNSFGNKTEIQRKVIYKP